MNNRDEFIISVEEGFTFIGDTTNLDYFEEAAALDMIKNVKSSVDRFREVSKEIEKYSDSKNYDKILKKLNEAYDELENMEQEILNITDDASSIALTGVSFLLLVVSIILAKRIFVTIIVAVLSLGVAIATKELDNLKDVYKRVSKAQKDLFAMLMVIPHKDFPEIADKDLKGKGLVDYYKSLYIDPKAQAKFRKQIFDKDVLEKGYKRYKICEITDSIKSGVLTCKSLYDRYNTVSPFKTVCIKIIRHYEDAIGKMIHAVIMKRHEESGAKTEASIEYI